MIRHPSIHSPSRSSSRERDIAVFGRAEAQSLEADPKKIFGGKEDSVEEVTRETQGAFSILKDTKLLWKNVFNIK